MIALNRISIFADRNGKLVIKTTEYPLLKEDTKRIFFMDGGTPTSVLRANIGNDKIFQADHQVLQSSFYLWMPNEGTIDPGQVTLAKHSLVVKYTEHIVMIHGQINAILDDIKTTSINLLHEVQALEHN